MSRLGFGFRWWRACSGESAGGVVVGFYLRKSMNAGPFRVNFSRSGVGGSIGVRGLRFGSGPRGTYVHVGTNGVYYRHVLTTRPRSAASADPSVRDPDFHAGQFTDWTGVAPYTLRRQDREIWSISYEPRVGIRPCGRWRRSSSR
ncbi:DUF4236 domain-containing protein [Nocardia heshunensis]